MKIEIAAFNYESAIIADQNGADRIEYCANWKDGGTTPDVEEVKTLLEKINTPLTIMIRPRGGDFQYSEQEFNDMKESIEKFKDLPVLGFVFGILTSDQEIDSERNQELIKTAGDKICVMHRAFDKTPNMNLALESVIECGFHTILTSGHAKNVEEGLENLKKLQDLSQNRIQIMPGGGLRSSNLNRIKSAVNCEFFHSSGIVDESGIANANEIKRLKAH